MPFNLQTFKTRAITAIVFVVVMLAGLFTNNWSFLLLFSIIHFGCWAEYQKLISIIYKEYAGISNFHKYGIRIAGFGFMLFMLNNTYSIAGFKLHELGWWLLIIAAIVLPIAEILLSKKLNTKLVGYSFLGLVYISLSWGLLMDFINFEFNNYSLNKQWQAYVIILPCFAIGCMWVNDTMAYLVGSFIGKTPLSKISPKKTWEGTIGGIILCALAMGFFMFMWDEWFVYNKGFWFWFLLAAIAAIVGTIGDLLESKLKRMAGVKDSGNFMPGHGGFLDRFDSLILATPFIWLYLKLFL